MSDGLPGRGPIFREAGEGLTNGSAVSKRNLAGYLRVSAEMV